jgi:hypothetical protein
MMLDERKWSVHRVREAHGKTDQEYYYRATVDGVELQTEICATGSQIAQYGEFALMAWCRRNSHLLTRKGIVRAELS